MLRFALQSTGGRAPDGRLSHCHVQGPLPETETTAPLEHKLFEGCAEKNWLLDDPQIPGTGVFEEHCASLPPCIPLHLHLKSTDVSATSSNVPRLQRFTSLYALVSSAGCEAICTLLISGTGQAPSIAGGVTASPLHIEKLAG
jgi:hypothetical protein